jgi:hypothetical protein
MKIHTMTNAETATHLRQYVMKSHSVFSWPTDACGYTQHIRFVRHRNANWDGFDFNAFVLKYADALECGNYGPDPTE